MCQHNKNITKKNRYDDEDYDFFENSITYNNAQFIILLIIVIFIIVYPVLVWLSSPKSEPGPSIQDIKKASNEENKKNKDRKRNKKNDSTELSLGVGYNSGSSGGYDSSYAQQGYNSQQPNYAPPYQYQQPAQPIYQGGQPLYQPPQGYQPGALYSQ